MRTWTHPPVPRSRLTCITRIAAFTLLANLKTAYVTDLRDLNSSVFQASVAMMSLSCEMASQIST